MAVQGTVVAVCHSLINIRTLSVLVTDCIDVPCSGSPRHQDMGVLPFLVRETACKHGQ